MDYERRVHVARSPAELFAYLSDEKHLLAWRDGLVAVKRLDDGAPDAPSRRYAETLETPLGRQTMTVELTSDVVDRAFAFEVVDGPVRPRGEMRLRAEDAGTELAYRVTYPTMLPIATPIDKMVFAALKASIDRTLENLQRLLAADVR